MSRYYDRQGQPMEEAQWVLACGDPEQHRVAWTKSANGEVSTVWLGRNRGSGSGILEIFETRVFGGYLNGECVRYATEAEARAGHADMVGRVAATHPAKMEEE